jgi:hypothetical protein
MLDADSRYSGFQKVPHVLFPKYSTVPNFVCWREAKKLIQPNFVFCLKRTHASLAQGSVRAH